MEFPILGRACAAEVHTPALAEWLRENWSFPEHALAAVPYRIALQEVEAPPRPVAGAPVPVRLHRLTLTARVADEGAAVWTFGAEATGAQLRTAEREASIVVWGLNRPGQPHARTLGALRVSMVEALRASGLLPVHAAVAVREGRATALAGRSGVGKSTTLWRALGAGWAPLAEDFAWLDPGSGLVHGWDRGLRLWPAGRAAFAPRLPATRARLDPDGKLCFPYACLSPASVRTAALSRLVLLERAGSDGEGGPSEEPVPLAPRDAVRVWWEATGVPLAPAVQERVAAEIAALVRRVAAVRVRLGPGALPSGLF